MKRGEQGFINEQKKNYLIKVGTFFSLVIVVFIISEVVVFEEFAYLKVLSALMMLPTALYIAKYYTLMHYVSNKTGEIDLIEGLIDVNSIVSEVVLARDKYTIYYNVIALKNDELIIFKKRFTHRENEKATVALLTNIFMGKGIELKITVYDELDSFCDYLKGYQATGANDLMKVKELRQVLLDNAV